MRLPLRRRGDPRRLGRRGAEYLAVDAVWSNAPVCKAGGEVAHESRRSAQIVVGISRQSALLQCMRTEASARVEIHAGPILGSGRAVVDIAAAVRQGFEERAGLVGERMLTSVAGAVQPPDFSWRCRSRQRMEHCQYGRGANTGAQKNDGSIARPKREAATCRAGLHAIADLQFFVDVSAGCAVRLALDADAIALSARFVRQRVAAHQDG